MRMEDLILANSEKVAKSIKINPLKNYMLYGSLMQVYYYRHNVNIEGQAQAS